MSSVVNRKMVFWCYRMLVIDYWNFLIEFVVGKKNMVVVYFIKILSEFYIVFKVLKNIINM